MSNAAVSKTAMIAFLMKQDNSPSRSALRAMSTEDLSHEVRKVWAAVEAAERKAKAEAAAKAKASGAISQPGHRIDREGLVAEGINPDRFYTPTEAGIVLGVSVYVPQRWVREGMVTNHGRDRFAQISGTDLLAMVEAGKVKPKSKAPAEGQDEAPKADAAASAA